MPMVNIPEKYNSVKTERLCSVKTKCQCPDCGRLVSYARLKLHRKTSICLVKN